MCYICFCPLFNYLCIGCSLLNFFLFCVYGMQRSLATDLQNLSVELRKKQSTYLKRLRQQKEVSEELFGLCFLLDNKEIKVNDVPI